MSTTSRPASKAPASPLPARPRLVFRVGFAGRKELTGTGARHLGAALDMVLTVLGERLVSIAPGTPANRDEKKPPVSAYYSHELPLLRLVTGLCEGADSYAAEALGRLKVAADPSRPDGWLQTELAAVLPFDTDTYRRSRPENFQETYDRQLASCAWVLELDGRYEKPEPDTLEARKVRNRAYRAQSAFLLRHSDLVIAAADPSVPGKAGGTLETVREAQIFELPVVFIHTGTGAVYLIEPQDDLHSVMADKPLSDDKRRKVLDRWVLQLTADAESGLNPHNHDSQKAGENGLALLQEYFETKSTPPLCRKGKRKESWREIAWTWFQQRFGNEKCPFTKGLLCSAIKRLWRAPGHAPVCGARSGAPPTETFASYRERTTQLNYHYSGLYRGAFLINYAFAILAVTLAAMSLVLLGKMKHDPSDETTHPTTSHTPAGEQIGFLTKYVSSDERLRYLLMGMAIAKIGLLILISQNTRRANDEKWNDRAVDYRYLAERLRGMHYLPLAGSHQPPAAAPPQFASRVVRQSAVDWLFDAIVRSVSPAALEHEKKRTLPGSATAVITLDPAATLAKIRDGWIKDQVAYHEKNARVMHRMHELIEATAKWLGRIVIVIVAVDLVIVIAEILHAQHPAEPHSAWLDWVRTAESYVPWLVCAATVLPAIVAALGGVRFQTECQRLAERSAVVRVMLGGRVPAEKHSEPKGLIQRVREFCRIAWLTLRHLIGRPVAIAKGPVDDGRWKQADDLHRRITSQTSRPSSDVGSWSLDVLRVSEQVATDLVQEVAEWSVLYAKEVSEPG